MYSNINHGIRVYTHRSDGLKSSLKIWGVIDIMLVLDVFYVEVGNFFFNTLV